MTTIRVVAAVIEREGRLLLGRRPAHKRHGALWEFPGGKIEAGEDALAAARRELDEELGLDVESVGALLRSVADDDSPYVIDFYAVAATGTPAAREHSEVGWFAIDELTDLRLAPADRTFVEGLTTPA